MVLLLFTCAVGKKKERLSRIGLLLSKSNGFNSLLLTATVGLGQPGDSGLSQLMLDGP